MRVSHFYNLTGDQSTFDFVDVDLESDTPLFIDPALLASTENEWTEQCTYAIRDFFQNVLDRIRSNDNRGARALLAELGEVNATHLGYSGRSRGNGVGTTLAERFQTEIESSEAVRTGLISDLEDTALLVHGVRSDRISDVITNIIRRPLIEYTQSACNYYGIEMKPGITVGPSWDPTQGHWVPTQASLPMPNNKPLILVPKGIVRRSLHANPDEYYRHYVLEYFKEEELRMASPLTYLLKSGRLAVRKKDVENKQKDLHRRDLPGVQKRINLEGTEQNPALLQAFKQNKRENPPDPVTQDQLAKIEGAEIDYDNLLNDVLSTNKGAAAASEFERRVEGLLTAIFYPSLNYPIRQERIHKGRKILDISYTNVAHRGFFYWLALHYPAAHVVVECKNYTRDLGNPEYDQLSGRFSPSRGKYGLLVFRSCSNKERLFESCRDTSRDDRGFITPIDEEDLAILVKEAKGGSATAEGGLLHRRFKDLITQ